MFLATTAHSIKNDVVWCIYYPKWLIFTTFSDALPKLYPAMFRIILQNDEGTFISRINVLVSIAL